MYKPILFATLLIFMFAGTNNYNTTSPQKNTKAIAIEKTIDLTCIIHAFSLM